MWERAQQKHPAGSHGADGHSHGKLLPDPLPRARGTHTKQQPGEATGLAARSAADVEL